MSLVDPDARDRNPASAARRRLAWLIVLLVAAAAAGYGASIFGDFPGSSHSFGFDEYGPLTKITLLLAGFAGVTVAIGFLSRLPSVGGVRGRPTFLVALAGFAAAAGQFTGSLLPTVIPEYAERDLSDARTTVRVQSGVLLLGALLLMAWAVHAARGVRLRAALRAAGHRTSGVVTAVHDTGITTNNAPRVRLTVRFTDAEGRERFVRRRLTVSRLSPPGKGDRVPVWFDPKDPGNDRRIVVGADG